MDPEWLKQILGPLVQVLMARQQGPNFVEQGLRGAMATQGTPLPQMSPEARQQATQSLQGAGEMMAGFTPFDAPLAAVLAARDFGQGNWLSGGLNAAGVLPGVPPLGGMLKKTDDLKALLAKRDEVFKRLPDESTDDYLARTSKFIYSPENQQREMMQDFADQVLQGKAQPAVRADDGRVFTRKGAAEHGDLAPWAEMEHGASFRQPGWKWRGWLMGNDFISAEDIDPFLGGAP